MDADFSDIIANVVRQADPDLELRLKAQADALAELQCINPVIGKWVNEYHVEYLFASFSLGDSDFAEAFPAMAHLKQHDRERIIRTFNDHISQCAKCHLKRGYDMDFAARIERTCLENKGQILHQSESESHEAPAESEHMIRAEIEDVLENAAEVEHVAKAEIEHEVEIAIGAHS